MSIIAITGLYSNIIIATDMPMVLFPFAVNGSQLWIIMAPETEDPIQRPLAPQSSRGSNSLQEM